MTRIVVAGVAAVILLGFLLYIVMDEAPTPDDTRAAAPATSGDASAAGQAADSASRDDMVVADDLATAVPAASGDADTTGQAADSAAQDDGVVTGDLATAASGNADTAGQAADSAAQDDGVVTSDLATAASGNADTAGQAADSAAQNDDAVADDLVIAAPGSAIDGVTLPEFDIVRVERTGDAVIAGRAAPEAVVGVVVNGRVVTEVTADERGQWVAILDEPRVPGEYEFSLVAETAGETLESAQVVAVNVPSPSVSGDEELEDVLTVVLDRESSSVVEVMQGAEQGTGLSGGAMLALDSITYDDEGAVSLSGRASADNTVIVYIDNQPAATAPVDSGGAWHTTLPTQLEPGTYRLRVDETGSDSVVVARLETPFMRVAFTRPETSEPLIVIQPGNNLWLIARRVYGRGIFYTHIYEANRNQIADPDLIYPGQIFILPQSGNAEG